MELLFINTDSNLFNWVLLPLLILLARVVDQSIGTMRLIFLSKGHKVIAPILGFFEVIIWLIAIGQIMKQLNNVMCYIAYGGGFALGNYLGLILEEKLSIGNVVIRIIPKKDAAQLIAYLKSLDYPVTMVDSENKIGQTKMIFSIVKRQHIKEIIEVIDKYNPNAFYSIEDVKAVGEVIGSTTYSRKGIRYLKIFGRK